MFVVDAVEGALPADEDVAEALRATGKPVVLAVNKSDDRRAPAGALEFHRLGFEPVIEISAEHGRGIGDLLDEVAPPPRLAAGRGAVLPSPRRPRTAARPTTATRARDERPEETAVAIVGRPNVGKSSLVNRLLREERVLVSDMPGHDARCRSTRCCSGGAAVPHRRHRGHPPARAASRGRERSSASA